MALQTINSLNSTLKDNEGFLCIEDSYISESLGIVGTEEWGKENLLYLKYVANEIRMYSDNTGLNTNEYPVKGIIDALKIRAGSEAAFILFKQEVLSTMASSIVLEQTESLAIEPAPTTSFVQLALDEHMKAEKDPTILEEGQAVFRGVYNDEDGTSYLALGSVVLEKDGRVKEEKIDGIKKRKRGFVVYKRLQDGNYVKVKNIYLDVIFDSDLDKYLLGYSSEFLIVADNIPNPFKQARIDAMIDYQTLELPRVEIKEPESVTLEELADPSELAAFGKVAFSMLSGLEPDPADTNPSVHEPKVEAAPDTKVLPYLGFVSEGGGQAEAVYVINVPISEDLDITWMLGDETKGMPLKLHIFLATYPDQREHFYFALEYVISGAPSYEYVFSTSDLRYQHLLKLLMENHEFWMDKINAESGRMRDTKALESEETVPNMPKKNEGKARGGSRSAARQGRKPSATRNYSNKSRQFGVGFSDPKWMM